MPGAIWSLAASGAPHFGQSMERSAKGDLLRLDLHGLHQQPMAFRLDEEAVALVRVPEQVLVPAVDHAPVLHGAVLEAHDLQRLAADGPARADGNLRGRAELRAVARQHLVARVARVEDGA